MHRPAQQVPPLVPAQAQFLETTPATDLAAQPAANWWESFEGPLLNELIGTALAGNLELRQLAARIEQANALWRQAGAPLFPTLEGGGSVESRWTDLDDRRATAREDSTSLGVVLDWELDVWGRLRSARRARELEIRAAVSDWQGGRLLLSAAIAETHFEMVEQHQQLRLLQEQIENNQTLLDLTKLRFGQGQSSIVDVLQQRVQLDSTQARVPEIEARLQQLGYALDVLVGRAPGNRVRLALPPLDAPPPLPAAGVPSQLLARRPDLVAAQARVNALDYRVGEAVAARLPRFVLSGSLAGTGDPGLNALVASAMASVLGPIFDAGARKAEVEFRRAQLQEAVAGFSQAFLAAVRDVETALLRERKQAERVALLADQLANAQRLLHETRHRYSQGLTDYLPVLTAVVTVQNLEREVLTSRRQLLTFRVALHRALGGPMRPVAEPTWAATRS